jgi:TRAP-type C4-dicarboxylate transport system permease small subunit
MSELGETDTRPTDPVGRVLHVVTRALALVGGLVLCAMALLTTISVTGRSFLNMPVLGDFELIAVGTGVAVFAFLPYCHLVRENVLVDFFLSAAPFRVKAFFDTVANLLYVVIIVIMTWRMTLGGIDLYEADQMTMILEIPLWWTFPAALLCLVLLLAVCLYTFGRSINEMRLNRTL